MTAGMRARLRKLEGNLHPPMVWPNLYVTKPDGQRVDLFHDVTALAWLGWATMAKDDPTRSA